MGPFSFHPLSQPGITFLPPSESANTFETGGFDETFINFLQTNISVHYTDLLFYRCPEQPIWRPVSADANFLSDKAALLGKTIKSGSSFTQCSPISESAFF